MLENIARNTSETFAIFILAFNPLKSEERERVRNNSRRGRAKRKMCGRSERHFISGGRKSIILLKFPMLCSLVLLIGIK
jgi:hypothetical protein